MFAPEESIGIGRITGCQLLPSATGRMSASTPQDKFLHSGYTETISAVIFLKTFLHLLFFEGNIPTGLSKLRSLQSLNFQKNFFSGKS